VDTRCISADDEIKMNQEVICTNLGMYGLLATIQKRDRKKKAFKVQFDVEQEQGKVHDPFMA
jgi:hypothetical protein